jgi:hypothetical protein
MTDPFAPPDWQQWQSPVAAPLAEPEVTTSQIDWRREGLVALIVTAYSVILGAIIGRLWPVVAPHVALVRAVNGSEAASKALLGDDMWFALLAITAAAVAVAGVVIVDRTEGGGPGAIIGLAVGGLLGSLVAAHIGHHVQSPHVAALLHRSFPGITAHSQSVILSYFDFSLRMKAMLVVWPLTAVVLQACVVSLRSWRESSTTLAP